MYQQIPNTIIKSGLKILSLALILFFCQQSMAAITDVTLTCPDLDDPLSCELTSSNGNVQLPTLSMLSFATDLIETTIKSGVVPTESSCSGSGSNFTCNIGTEDYPLNMGCSYDKTTNSVDCRLEESPETFSIGCNSNDVTNSCYLKSNSDTLFDQLPKNQMSANISALAESILSCANFNTFGNFKNTCDKLMSLILSGDTTEAIAIIEKLQPINPDASVDLSKNNLRQAFHTVQGRLSRLRSGINIADNVQTQQYFVNQEWHEAGTLFAQNTTSTNDATKSVVADRNISEYGKLGFFINVALINADEKKGIELDTESDSQVFTLGIDYRFADNLIGGLAFNINQSKTDVDNQATLGKLEADGYSFLVYGSFYQDNWFIDASITQGGDRYEQTREPNGVVDVYESNFNSKQSSFSVSGGYDFHIQAFSITPFAQYTIGSITIDGYKEKLLNGNGQPGASIEIDEQDNDIGTFNIGSHFRYIVNTSKGVFIPSISLTLVNDFEDDAQMVSGRFVGNYAINGGFSLQTNKIDSSYMIVGLGISAQFKNGNAGFLSFETIEGYDNLDQQRITAGWRFEF